MSDGNRNMAGGRFFIRLCGVCQSMLIDELRKLPGYEIRRDEVLDTRMLEDDSDPDMGISCELGIYPQELKELPALIQACLAARPNQMQLCCTIGNPGITAWAGLSYGLGEARVDAAIYQKRDHESFITQRVAEAREILNRIEMAAMEAEARPT